MIYALPVDGIDSARNEIENLGGVVLPSLAPSVELLVRADSIGMGEIQTLLRAWGKDEFTLLDDGQRTVVGV